MPLAKHRPDFAELIDIAALQKQSIDKRQKKHYTTIRKQTIQRQGSNNNLGEGSSDGDNDKESSARKALDILTTHHLLVDISDRIRWILDSFLIRAVRIGIMLLAFLNLTYEAQTIHRENSKYDNAALIVDFVVSLYFIVEGTLKLFAFYAHLDMHKVFDSKVDSSLLFRKLGIVDITLGVLSLNFRTSVVGGWFRLLRVFLFAYVTLEETPHLVILVSGITHGLRSIMSTCLLLSLVFMIYSTFGMFFFADNDPYHFGTIALSMWSFFELATLDNWSQVLYVNMYGCDRFPAYYTVVDVPYTGQRAISRYGSTLLLPICTSPEENRIISAVIFLSFIVFCGFILVNITLAAVTSGIKMRLDRINHETDDAINRNDLLSSESNCEEDNNSIDKSLIGDPDMLLMMLKQVWREQDAHARRMLADKAKSSRTKRKHKSMDESSLCLHVHEKSTIKSTAPSMKVPQKITHHSHNNHHSLNHQFHELDDDLDEHHSEEERNYWEWRSQSILFRDVLSHHIYQYVMFALIAFSALLVLVILQSNGTPLVIRIINLLLQIIFSLDTYIQAISTYPNFQLYYGNKWQFVDGIFVAILWIPVLAWGYGPNAIGKLNFNITSCTSFTSFSIEPL